MRVFDVTRLVNKEISRGMATMYIITNSNQTAIFPLKVTNVLHEVITLFFVFYSFYLKFQEKWIIIEIQWKIDFIST